MPEWIFTFGFGHVHPYTGEKLGNSFVRIKAETANAARDEMFRLFGSKWAFQYDSEELAGVQKWNLHEVFP